MSDPVVSPIEIEQGGIFNSEQIDPFPIPEWEIEQWRWIYEQKRLGTFNDYVGKHVAVMDNKILGASYDRELLAKYIALRDNIDPERLVIAYID